MPGILPMMPSSPCGAEPWFTQDAVEPPQQPGPWGAQQGTAPQASGCWPGASGATGAGGPQPGCEGTGFAPSGHCAGL